MRGRDLHDALRRLARDVAELLTSELDGGAELPFEVVEERGGGRTRGGPVLYRYSPLTASFVADRWERVRQLDSHAEAVAALGSGAGPYLRHRGLQGTDPDQALLDVMQRLFEDATSFSLPEERLSRVTAELEATLEGSTVRATVAAALHGVRIASARVEVADGLSLRRRAALQAPPGALEGSARAAESTNAMDDDDATQPRKDPLDVFCVFERELPLDAPLPVDEARVHFRRILTSLRLSGAGGTALGPLAWARAGAGAWHAVALGISARTRPESWELHHSEEHELRELMGILALSRHSAAVGWAMGRFEMGCERGLEQEALSDYLLGLRALLADPGTRAERSTARRLAALCATDDERDAVEERARQAFAFERHLIHGEGSASMLSLDSPRALVREIEQYLRALLRDVLCGYLDEDLRGLADEVLTAAETPPDPGVGEIQVHDTRSPSEEDTAELEVVGTAVTPSVDWESG